MLKVIRMVGIMIGLLRAWIGWQSITSTLSLNEHPLALLLHLYHQNPLVPLNPIYLHIAI